MIPREQKFCPDLTVLGRTESGHLSFMDRRVPCGQNIFDRERDCDFRCVSADACLDLDHVEMHIPCHYSASTGFERQDSLARAATLQQCDRIRDPGGILDFLETTMNIEDYLQDIHDNVPVDDMDPDDVELQKRNLLYKVDKVQTCGVNNPFSRNDDVEELVSTVLMAKTLGQMYAEAEIKTEPCWDSSCPSTSSVLSSRRGRQNVQPTESRQSTECMPTTPARKYRLKTPQERSNISYKVKRQRNNDAVRRSRSKAKQLQLMKEKQLEEALLEVTQLKEKLRVVSERLSRCRCRN